MGAAEGGEGVDEWGGLGGEESIRTKGEGGGREGGGVYIERSGPVELVDGEVARKRGLVGVAKRKDEVGGMAWEGLMRADAVFLLRSDFFPCREERRPAWLDMPRCCCWITRRVKAGLGEVGGAKLWIYVRWVYLLTGGREDVDVDD